ncbi:amino acid ABC transporter permease [Pseudoramibacter faecis]|uniref:amino acid ABC transporter permease n=1 Tax=Pseudoramibacter faecis TaxID=3108534 RepID=UPI002E781A29|nr:amino acid ABC transporter permease [Pseudoramibacter sp. HA2172]
MDYVLTLLTAIMAGLGKTLSLFAICLIVSLPLGFGITMMLRSRVRLVKAVAEVYVYILRGTPLLLQLFFVYFGLPFIPGIGKVLMFDRFTAACVAFALNYAAYFAEIFRGGLLAIDDGQYEAAKVLGLTRGQTMLHIIIPQMIRVSLPSVSNETIVLVKDTALVTAIAVPEIMYYAKGAVVRDADTTAFIVAGGIYLVINFVITLIFKQLEKKADF